MSPEESRRQEAEPVDMSPAAIMQRLQLVGQLNDLCVGFFDPAAASASR